LTVCPQSINTFAQIHEHQNPSKNPIEWNVDVVVTSLRGPPNNWSDETIHENIFKQYSQSELHGTHWDSESIMQYFYPSGWVKSGEGSDVTQYLSQIDRQFMKSTYPQRKTTFYKQSLINELSTLLLVLLISICVCVVYFLIALQLKRN
jgi:hypothetical protein